jgi:hypothetical protein
MDQMLTTATMLAYKEKKRNVTFQKAALVAVGVIIVLSFVRVRYALALVPGILFASTIFALTVYLESKIPKIPTSPPPAKEDALESGRRPAQERPRRSM